MTWFEALALLVTIVALLLTIWLSSWRDGIVRTATRLSRGLRYVRARRRLAWNHRSMPKLSEAEWRSVSRFLANRYRVEPFSVGGRVYPVTVLWKNVERLIDPDAVLGDLDRSAPRPRSRPGDREFVRAELEDERNPRENVNFALKEVRLAEAIPKIDAYLGLYYDGYIGQQGLGRELNKALAGRRDVGGLATMPASAVALPARARVDEVAKELTEGLGRVASLGVSTLFVCRRQPPGTTESRYWVALMRRSAAVAVDPGRFHVIPAGMFESTYGDLEHEWSLRANVMREFLEELYSYDEATRPSKAIPDGVMGEPEVRALMELEQAGRAEFSVTGIACSLLTRQVEVCTVLVVDDPSYVVRFPQQAGWTHKPPTDGSAFPPSVAAFVPLEAVEELISESWRSPNDVTMSGLVAAALGLEWIRNRPRSDAFIGSDASQRAS